MARRKKRKKKNKQKRKSASERQNVLNRALGSLRLKNYRTDAFVPIIAENEIAIHETFIITERELTDREVSSGLRRLILDLRTKGYQSLKEEFSDEVSSGAWDEVVVWNIMRRWMRFFKDHDLHSDADLAGCVATTLSSVKTWSTPEDDSRGFLYFLEGFVTRCLGVEVRMVSEDGEERPEKETPESWLLERAGRWMERRDAESWMEFEAAAEELTEDWKPSPVIHVCQYLIGWANDMAITEKLRPIIRSAFRRMGPNRPSRRG